MKTYFMQKQPTLNIVETNKYFYIFICLNGKEKKLTSNDEAEATEQLVIEYDYTELRISKDNPQYDIEDVKNHPEKYIDINDDLKILKEKKINESKNILEEYLSAHPLFSTAKYSDGRYYTVTSEKQRQLTSKMAMYNIYEQQGKEYELLKWNDTGNVCEPWTIEELTQLSMEIDAYVTPLVSKQQLYEVDIKKAATENELNDIQFVLE